MQTNMNDLYRGIPHDFENHHMYRVKWLQIKYISAEIENDNQGNIRSYSYLI